MPKPPVYTRRAPEGLADKLASYGVPKPSWAWQGPDRRKFAVTAEWPDGAQHTCIVKTAGSEIVTAQEVEAVASALVAWRLDQQTTAASLKAADDEAREREAKRQAAARESML